MLNRGKGNIVGILVDAVDYEAALDRIFRAARGRRSMAVSALAVHGVMTGVLDREHKYRLNHFDLLVPDGQPVRWALNWLHRARLSDRVYGPKLTLEICTRAASEGTPLYFYGSTPAILQGLRQSLEKKFPGIAIAGMEPSKFRRMAEQEKQELVERIRGSGASILFVGLGCPRQEIFAYEFRDLLPMPILAVGAAFPFLAGSVRQAPSWMQKRGLEWLFRLGSEPLRLWRRYVFLNPAYLTLLTMQALGFVDFRTDNGSPPSPALLG